MKNSTLRLAITTKCNRDCSYCLMKQLEVISQFKPMLLSEINWEQYSEVFITGGEPCMDISLLEYVISRIQGNQKVYLYTNGDFLDDLMYSDVLPTGVNIGLHDEKIAPELWKTARDMNEGGISIRLFRLNNHEDVVSGKFQDKCRRHGLSYRILEMNEPCTIQNDDKVLVRI